MNAEDRQLIQFAANWAPFGGAPPGEIFVTFGMSVDRYQSRLRHILHTREGDWFADRVMKDGGARVNPETLGLAEYPRRHLRLG
ncbi:hypothetical protein HYG77_33065 (plasmid) [Rhodococcus sp. ZPP]|uniref:hypothetical protein n=1 Tax=Rhodococcus sp. ZPP TaxID=2749906 RepID=UPI001AD8654E|nr:hypothetical protein [Rhodococcus sp. ZPP]QTJ70381.1 hypothetical protein HYG77_33065 [Rhodococcus sp. ZPP]